MPARQCSWIRGLTDSLAQGPAHPDLVLGPVPVLSGWLLLGQAALVFQLGSEGSKHCGLRGGKACGCGRNSPESMSQDCLPVNSQCKFLDIAAFFFNYQGRLFPCSQESPLIVQIQ